MFDMVLSLRYEFVLKTDFVKEAADNVFDFNLFFDMPKSAVIGGFGFQITVNVQIKKQYY